MARLTPCPCVFAAVVIGGCAAAERTTLDSIPAAPTRATFDQAAGIPVGLGPRSSLTLTVDSVPVERIIFDTGAGGVVLRPEIAGRLDLPRIGDATVVSPAGSRRSHQVWLDQIELGGLLIEHLRGVELDTGFIGRIGLSRVNGLIGLPVLEHAVVELRLGADALAIHDPQTYALPRGSEWTPLRLVQQGLVIDAHVEGHPITLQIDSGAELSLQVSGQAAARLGLTNDRRGSRRTVAVMDGSFRTLQTTLDVVSFANATQQNVAADVVLDPDHTFATADGLLGRELLEHFTVVLDLPHRRTAFIPFETD